MSKRILEVPVDTLRSLTLLAELVDEPAASDLAVIARAHALLLDGMDSRPTIEAR